MALAHGALDVAARLIHVGANVEQPDRYGVTPLLLAATGGQLPLVRQLLDARAAQVADNLDV